LRLCPCCFPSEVPVLQHPRYMKPAALVQVPRLSWDVFDHAFPLALRPSHSPFLQTYVVLFCSAEFIHASCHRQDTKDGMGRTVAYALVVSHGRCESLQWALSMTNPTFSSAHSLYMSHTVTIYIDLTWSMAECQYFQDRQCMSQFSIM
jgi:hypothetical protein